MFITNWALTFAFIYSLLSVINTFIPLSQPKNYYPPSSWVIYCWIVVSWVLFEIAAHLQIMVTIIYWSLFVAQRIGGGVTPELTPDRWFLQVMSHGGIFLLLWI